MPGELILVPKSPNETEHHGSGGNEISEAAPEQLARRWLESIEADYAKSAQGHSRGGSRKVREESDVLGVEQSQSS